MQPRVRELLEYLEASDRVLDDAVAGVPEAVRDRQPLPGSWSPAEVLEHLSLVESGITQRIGRQLEAARVAGLRPEQATDSVLPSVPIARLLNREARIVASERAHPTAGLTWPEGRAAIATARERTRELLLAHDGLALGDVLIPHAVLGPLNVYQWIVFIGAHQQRHAAQIREAGQLIAMQS